ncbi:alpha-1,3-mannosyl-glycoprotein 4-beta-N-acetylglucosaminyltransferase C [Bombina bombina]|uniref:alpha-1,3-mannosyl-glycoprotein 4-beta-N-acetylglucosaminyltransferase C n=1 Tax=Bombina bombina TaxID=8345 RepID=UPI00235A65F8|nr:alpha-1,3-mannosyl-glycoprotein 4-beta-N-acetylglucosaminyltransferase C [Bombina bombina]
MRCSLRRSVTTSTLCLIVFLLVVIFKKEDDVLMDAENCLSRTLSQQELLSTANAQIFQELWNRSSPISTSYLNLAGFPSINKKYLTIGLSSVKRKGANYVLETIKSIFDQSSEDELKEMVVVVHLADFNMKWNVQMAKEISQMFSQYILKGHLLLIHAPQELYPPLEGLKRNYNDPEDRVKFRSKQNVDYAFLMNFCANLSTYYLMIEDDVHCSKSFLASIKKAITSKEGSYWVTLEFSKLGYIGKLYQSRDLPRLTQFLLAFYQEMPCDWLLVHFRLLLTQKDVIRFKPSLFQHIGLYSSFRGTKNHLKDDDFEEDPFDIPDNPVADVLTNIATFKDYHPNKAYGTKDGYFWGESPQTGSYFALAFHKPAHLSRISIRTGSDERKTDILLHGHFEVSKERANGKDCSNYIQIGTFNKGVFEKNNLEDLVTFPAQCIRIYVSKSQNEWLIIKSIKVWTT